MSDNKSGCFSNGLGGIFDDNTIWIIIILIILVCCFCGNDHRTDC